MLRPLVVVVNVAAWVGDWLLGLVPDDLFDVWLEEGEDE